MAVTNEQLVAVLSAQVTKFEKAMDKAAGKADRSFTKIERRGKTMEKRLAALAPNFRSLLGPLALAGAIRGFQQFADAATRIENSLKVAGLEGDALEEVFQKLEQSAKNNFAPFETLAQLYSRAALAQKELGASTDELLNFTDKVALALRVSGKSAAESRGALIQLSQAIGAGIVRAEEFNAILEGALPIAQAAAAGLKEAGGSVAKLRTLIIDGKVSSEAFFRAFEAGSVILEGKVAGATITTGQAFENLKTSMISAVRKIDDATGFTNALAGAMNSLAQQLNSADASHLIGQLGLVVDKIQDGLNAVERWKQAFRDFTGLSELDKIGRASEDVRVDNAFNAAFASGSAGSDLTEQKLKQYVSKIAAAGGAEVSPVSLKDFKAPTSNSKGKTPSEKFGDDIARIKARTLALQAETAAQAQLNPLINDYEYAVTKAATVQDLLNEAKKAGLTVTPELRANIEQLAEAYANATVEAAQLEESQAKVVQRAEDFNALGKDVLGGFISDMRQGKSAADALANSLNKIADKLLDMALNNLFSLLPGGSGFTGLPINLLSGKKAAGGPVSAGKPYLVGEQGPEVMVPGRSGTIIPNHKISGGGANQVVNVYNSTGQPVERQTRRGSDGTEILDIWIGKSIASGKQDKAMASRYGTRAQPLGVG